MKRQKLAAYVATGLLGVGLTFSALPVLATPDPAPRITELVNQSQDVFPTPPGVQESAGFWRKVFAEWHLNQVALHDAEHLGLVYEVVDLEGEAQEAYTRAQSDLVRRHRELLEARLERLATADELSLSQEDLALRRRIVDVAGEQAVAEAYLRVRAQRGLRERFQRGLEISGRYDQMFRNIFREEGVPEDLAYLPHVESSFQNNARSSVGASGMWQFTRSAGRMFMTVNRSIDERLDPVSAARGAARYLRQAHDLLGDWALAITSYNHGVQGMMRAKAQYGTDFDRIMRDYESRSFKFASRNFYAEFLAVRDIASHYEHYFPEGVALRPPLDHDRIELDKAMSSRDLARRYDVPHATLVELNPAWLKRVVNGVAAIPAGAEVWLPAGTLNRGERGRVVAAVERDAVETADVTVHRVEAGDTLSGIAKQYGLTVDALRILNGLAADQDVVKIGQRLRVKESAESSDKPADKIEVADSSDAVVHVVRKGDTPWLIAANYGVTVRDLLVNNQLNRRAVLRPGQRLEIPVH